MKQVKIAALSAAVAAALSMSARGEGSATSRPAETAAERDARMAWWRAARFGMFIHWGVYSVPAGIYDGKPVEGIGEWIMLRGKIPVAEYAKFPAQFDAAQFDADAWVTLAKDAGMKYIVITSKHHDGFAMFHTAVDRWNVYDATPFKRDPLAELAAACQRQGMRLGFYYSQAQDWNHPGGAAARGGHWDPAQDGDFAKYAETVALPQVKELLTKYGPVSVFWFDTPTPDVTPELAQKFVDLLHEHQPQIVWNNRLGGGFKGDTETPEQFIPPTGFPGRDWESCMTINGTWGFKRDDTKFKPTVDLVRHLCDAASKGGNYLLNVGPDSHGAIPQPEIDRLREIGVWLEKNGEAIYGTAASPFPRALPFGYATQKEGKLYLSVFDAPADRTLWLPTTSRLTRAYLLGQPDAPLAIGSRDGGATIALPDAASDSIASVVAVEYAGDRLATFAPPVDPAASGTFDLTAANADLAGEARVAMGRPTDRKGVNVVLAGPGDVATWSVRVDAAGTYSVSADVVSGKDESGMLALSAGGRRLEAAVSPSTASDGHSSVTLGTLQLPAGTSELRCVATPASGVAAIHLHGLTLSPAK